MVSEEGSTLRAYGHFNLENINLNDLMKKRNYCSTATKKTFECGYDFKILTLVVAYHSHNVALKVAATNFLTVPLLLWLYPKLHQKCKICTCMNYFDFIERA